MHCPLVSTVFTTEGGSNEEFRGKQSRTERCPDSFFILDLIIKTINYLTLQLTDIQNITSAKRQLSLHRLSFESQQEE